jgi:hypothetical protein
MTELVSLAALLLVLVTTAVRTEFNDIYFEGSEMEKEDEHYLYNFTLPSDLKIGAASAAYQYEGAWDEGGTRFFLKSGTKRR